MLEGDLTATVDDGVTFAFAITNGNDEPVGLVFRDAMPADVVVCEGDREVWRYSAGRMAAQAIREASLAPGESATFEMEWPDPPPGEYRARAQLRTREHDATAGTEFRVPADGT